MAQKKRSINWIYILLGVFILLGAGAWWWHEYGQTTDERFAVSNGRLEATEIDVAAKMSGRLKEVLVREGDLVQAGEIVARMDPRSLNAQLAQAQAQKARSEERRVGKGGDRKR